MSPTFCSKSEMFFIRLLLKPTDELVAIIIQLRLDYCRSMWLVWEVSIN